MDEDEAETLSCGQRIGRFFKAHWRGIILVVTPLLASPLLFMTPLKQMRCGFILILMATYWISEALPLGVTGIFPMFLFPLMDIMSSNETCMLYFKSAIFLFFGGLVVALAIEYSNLHKRVALGIMLTVGCHPRVLHLSMVSVTCFISFWLSNSAATALMCPIIKALLVELDQNGVVSMYNDEKVLAPGEPRYPSDVSLAYFLGTAYAASIGGCGTLIGTGTNIVFKGLYDSRFPNAGNLEFVNFSFYTIPSTITNMILVYLWLQWYYMGLFRPNSQASADVRKAAEAKKDTEAMLRLKRNELGPWTCHEIQVGIVFLIMIFLFLAHKPKFVKGYADIMNEKQMKSSIPAIIAALLLFLLPVNYMFMKYCICRRPTKEGPTPSLISWAFIHKNFSWGLLLLLGGGLVLSEGIKRSGLAILVAKSLVVFDSLPPPVLQLLAIITGMIFTAFSANMAMCSILAPIMLELAVVLKIHPAYLGLPCALAISLAFHFPISTPPNAIVAVYADIRTKDMMLCGCGPSLLCIVSLFLYGQTWGYLVFDEYSGFPEWAGEKGKEMLMSIFGGLDGIDMD